MTDPRPVVVIVGAGFGGMRAARALRRAPVQVVMVDRHNYHLFQPLLYQVATAGLASGEIAYPVRAVLRDQRNLQFRLGEVTEVDLAERQVVTPAGPLRYDYLVIACGAQTDYYGLHSVAQHAFGLKDLDEAVAIRNQVLHMFELAVQEADAEVKRAMLTFVVVGGGPTGVESAGALAELARLVQLKDFAELRPADLRVVLLEAGGSLLSGMPESLQEAAAETLWQKHVEVRFGTRVIGYDGRHVSLKGGEVIPARTLIWAAGARAASLAEGLDAPRGSLGRVAVNAALQLPDHPEVYVIGDAAYWETDGLPLPMVAPAAIQQAEHAVGNILRQITGREVEPFVYKSPGVLATIGRNAAVAQVAGLNLRGFAAWLVWLVVHIMRLVGFRNRLIVLINWAWDYLFYDRAVRVILPCGKWPWTERESAGHHPDIA